MILFRKMTIQLDGGWKWEGEKNWEDGVRVVIFETNSISTKYNIHCGCLETGSESWWKS